MKCACGCSTQESAPKPTTTHQHSSTCGCAQTATAVAGIASGTSSAAESFPDASEPGDDDPPVRQSVSHTVAADTPCDCGHDHETEVKTYEKISLIVAGVFLAIALAAEHLIGSDLLWLGASAVSIIAGLVIILPETIESLRARSIDINVLMVVAIIGAIYVQAYEEAAAVLFLFSIGEFLEGRAMRKSNDAIKDLAKLAPDTALVVRNGNTQEMPTDQVMLGETVVLKPGMSAPLDGVIIKGGSSFNDAAITGESVPTYKGIGDKVYAASIAVDGACEFETTTTIENSTLAKISEMVAQAQQQKSARESFVQRFAKIYTPLVVLAAVLVAFIPPALTAFTQLSLGDLNTWIYRACELLVISCPCAFVISTPVTIVSALTRAAKLGVLVKGGLYFEEAAKAGAIAFDKTGTLTEGKPTVSEIVIANSTEVPGSSAEAAEVAEVTGAAEVAEVAEAAEAARHNAAQASLVTIAAALEQHSAHPLALAVTTYAQSITADALPQPEDIVEIAGKGLSGTVDGKRYAIGSKDYLISETGLSDQLDDLERHLANRVGTTLFLAALDRPAKLLGVFVVADNIREDSYTTITALKQTQQHLKTVMLTGDNRRTAEAVARAVGVDEVHASLLPEGKTVELDRLASQHGIVAFVGDGINDAPSIAAANVGIAMGGAGSDAALSSADVVLMADDIAALPKFFSLSSKAVAIIRQNVVLAIGLKVLVALLVVVGVASMWMAVLADTGVSLLVILNGMRLMRTRL